MKKSFKILSLCVALVFAFSFSAFGSTNGSVMSFLKLKNGTVIKVEKTLEGKVKSIQFANGKKVDYRNIQAMLNFLKINCLRLTNAIEPSACSDAWVIAGLAIAGATLACASLNPFACSLAHCCGCLGN